jgi:gliding motility-associated-like protein
MKNHVKKILTGTFILFAIALHNPVNAQCQFDFDVKVVQNSTCLANGIIQVTASSDDIDLSNVLITLSNSTSTINESASDNGHLFGALPPGEYTVTMQSVCKGTQSVVIGAPQTKTVLSEYVSMGASRFVRRNSLNCMNTGEISIDIWEGKPPYKIEITSKPDGYTGETTFEVYGNTSIEHLAPGSYTFTVSDACISKELPPTIIGKLDNDFPVDPYETYFSPSGCSQAYVYENSDVETNEYWIYYREFYEIAFTFDDPENWSSDLNGTKYFDLPQSYGELYADGKKMKVYLRLKGTECSKLVDEILFSEPPKNGVGTYINERACDGYNLSFYLGYEQLLCKPLKWEILDTSNTPVGEEENIDYFGYRSVENLSYNETYTIRITDGNGNTFTSDPVAYEKNKPSLSWWVSGNMENTYTYDFSYSAYDICRPHKYEIFDADSVSIMVGEEIDGSSGTIEGLEYDKEYIINIFDNSSNMISLRYTQPSPSRYVNMYFGTVGEDGESSWSCENYNVLVEVINIKVPYTWTVMDKDRNVLSSGVNDDGNSNVLPGLLYNFEYIIEFTDGVTTLSYDIHQNDITPPQPYISDYGDNDFQCDDYAFNFKIGNLFCLPYKWEIFDEDNNLVAGESELTTFDIHNVRLKYDKLYRLVVTDSKGTPYSIDRSRADNAMIPYIYSWERDAQCYDYEYVFDVYNVNCFPYKWEIFDADGAVVHSGTDILEMGEHRARLEYNKDYTVLITDGKGRESQLYSQRSYMESVPVNYYIYSDMSNCVSDSYSGYIAISGSLDSATRVRFVSGPQIPIHADTVLKESGYYFYPFSENYGNYEFVPIAEGEYVFEITDKCGGVHTKTISHSRTMTAEGFSYVLDEITDICGGITRAYPQGKVYNNGYPVETYFTLIESPDPSYVGAVISNGSYFSLSRDGRYVFEINGSSWGWNTCGIDTIVIDYAYKEIGLDGRSSYVCETGTIGHIRVQAKNGKPPYIYTLYHEDEKTPVEGVAPNNTGEFEYGAYMEKYAVKIQDACNTYTFIPVEINTLDQTTLLSGKTHFLKGETINLSSLVLGATEYKWSGPLDFQGDVRSVNIPDATAKHSGKYIIRVKPAGCDKYFTDSITIEVHDPPVPEVSNIDLCLADADLNLSIDPIDTKYEIRWYDENKTSTAAPVVNLRNFAEYTFYVTHFEKAFSYESEMGKLTVIVNPPPEKSANASGWGCADEYIEITVTDMIAGYVYTVFADAAATDTIFAFTATGEEPVSYTLPVKITENTNFYLQTATGAGCTLPPVAFQVVSGVFSGTVGNDHTICENNVPQTLTSTPATGGTGIYTYQWQQKNDDGEWADVETGTGGTTSSYSPPALTVTTAYRLKTIGGANPCDTVVSNEVTVMVSTPFMAGLIAENRTVTSGQTLDSLISLAPASGGGDENGKYAYQWQSDVNNSGWTDVADANEESYLPPPADMPVQYRRKVTSEICGTIYSNTITIIPVSPLSRQYIACENAVVTIGFKAMPNVTYLWYDSETGGNKISDEALANPVLTVTKDAQPVQTWWLEPAYNGISLPRYKIDMTMSDNCGTTVPTGCAVDGTLLFRENFDGYGDGPNPASPRLSAVPLPAERTTYDFTSTRDPNDGGYALAKYTDPSLNGSFDWYIFDDRTSPDNPQIGRYMLVNADYSPKIFYRQEINNLCEGSQLLFSAMVANCHYAGNTLKPDLIFSLIDKNTNDILVTFGTGDVPYSTTNVDWRQWGFNFTVPNDITSLILEIKNNQSGGIGNDLGLDDIEIRLCVPKAAIPQTTTADTTVCSGNPFTFTGSYTDDGTFGNDLVYRWEYNDSDDPNNHDNWSAVEGSTGTSSVGSVESSHTLDAVNTENAGYYRLIVTNQMNINKYNCRAMSDIIYLHVNKITVSPDELPVYEPGIPYSEQIESNAEGAIFNYIGNIIEGIDMTPDGLISGTAPESAGREESAFTVTVKDKNGCEASREYLLRTCDPAPELPFDTIVYCGGVQAQPLQASSPYGHPLMWYDAELNELPEAPTPRTNVSKQIFYVVQINEALHCKSPKATITVLTTPIPALDFSALAKDACYEGAPSIMLDGMHESYTYSVYSDNTSENALGSLTGTVSGTIVPDNIITDNTIYHIMVTDSLGCSSIDRTEVTAGVIKLFIEPEKLPPYIKNTGYEQMLTTNALSPVFTVADGHLPDGLTLTASGLIHGSVPGSYRDVDNIVTVEVHDLNGCRVAREYVFNGNFFVPKVFTPNGDGVNDIFMRGYELVILDRLGMELFRGNNGWDGTYNGKTVADDIYFYKLKYVNPISNTAEMITGYVGVHR